MKDYMAMFNEALEVVHGLGIETGNIVDVKLNYRAKNRLDSVDVIMYIIHMN